VFFFFVFCIEACFGGPCSIGMSFDVYWLLGEMNGWMVFGWTEQMYRGMRFEEVSVLC